MPPLSLELSSFFTLAVCSIVCAVIRWGHMCRPYDKNAAYFYPSRKLVTVFFLLFATLIASVVNWNDFDARFYARNFVILYIPAFASLMFRSYFGGITRKWIFAYILFASPSIVMLILLFFLACRGGDSLSNHITEIETIVDALSLLGAIQLFVVSRWLGKKIINYIHGEYSSEDDFPAKFAKTIIILPNIVWLLAFVVPLFNSPTAIACYNFLITAFGIALLLLILHPQRSSSAEIERSVAEFVNQDVMLEKSEDSMAISRQIQLPGPLKDRLEQQIRDIITGEQLYLQPHFTKNDLAKRLGTNRTYLTIVFRERFSSFYFYINSLRLAYADRLIAQNPGISPAELAASSGFGSVRTYNRVKKHLANS
ncbi:MAG: helix-turn-helix domain-containing protein [Muribaculaceae bacterium]